MVFINIECAMKQGIPELLESRILGIPVVAIVASRTRSLHDPTQQDFIHARTLSIYMCHT